SPSPRTRRRRSSTACPGKPSVSAPPCRCFLSPSSPPPCFATSPNPPGPIGDRFPRREISFLDPLARNPDLCDIIGLVQPTVPASGPSDRGAAAGDDSARSQLHVDARNADPSRERDRVQRRALPRGGLP